MPSRRHQLEPACLISCASPRPRSAGSACLGAMNDERRHVDLAQERRRVSAFHHRLSHPLDALAAVLDDEPAHVLTRSAGLSVPSRQAVSAHFAPPRHRRPLERQVDHFFAVLRLPRCRASRVEMSRSHSCSVARSSASRKARSRPSSIRRQPPGISSRSSKSMTSPANSLRPECRSNRGLAFGRSRDSRGDGTPAVRHGTQRRLTSPPAAEMHGENQIPHGMLSNAVPKTPRG